MVPLADDEAHLFSLRPESVEGPETLAACLRVLDDGERDQQRRFFRAEDRHLYLTAHAAVRACLSCYAQVKPAEWAFSKNAYGRPEILRPPLPRPLRFNLSHTRGMALILVAWEREIGVDVEDTLRPGETVELADSFFAPDEARELRSLPPSLWRKRFFELWTLKEAYIKARGMGLSIPLEQFAFALTQDGPIGIRFAGSLADDPSTWQFALLKPTPDHQAAAAFRRAAGESVLRLIDRGPAPLPERR